MNATNESSGEAEIAGGVGMRRGAAMRSLRSARGAAHSGAPRLTIEYVITSKEIRRTGGYRRVGLMRWGYGEDLL